MTRTLFQDSFFISGIMCFQGCGNTLQNSLHPCIQECIQEKLLPADAQLIIHAEPADVGIHQLDLYIESEDADFSPEDGLETKLTARLKEKVYFDIVDAPKKPLKKAKRRNRINLVVNLLALGLILCLALIFSPSILLTVILAATSFLTTAFTARDYLSNFFLSLGRKNLANMNTTISLGWFLALAHTLFHAISMPLMAGFSMIFMNFIMPIMLISCINVMDEIKRLFLEKSKKMRLQGMQTLFPQMSKSYPCYQLSQQQNTELKQRIESLNEESEQAQKITEFCNSTQLEPREKQFLREGMLIEVQANECFPVDCILLQDKALIDASHLTGESQQMKQRGQEIPAGAVNLDQKVIVYARKNTYNSTVNQLLFRSNRARNRAEPLTKPTFTYLYLTLIVLGLLTALIAPLALGIATLPLLLQNMMGVLFSICPCTIAIAHQFPSLISLYHRNKKGVYLREERLGQDGTPMHTVVFDKTGTLTTNDLKVATSDIPFNAPLWQRIYLLEKKHGGRHPLARTLAAHYEAHTNASILIDEVSLYEPDPQNRGLSALVQGKQIHLGNEAYIRSIDPKMPPINQELLEQGCSAVYVAEDGVYQGAIFIRAKPRPGVVAALKRLKKAGKRIIMLSGDNLISAQGFNKQIGFLFEEEDIHAGQTPADKETFIEELITHSKADPRGFWYVCDGLNDGPCSLRLSELGGLSCSVDNKDKATFFTDLCLGQAGLNYLFHHHQFNRFLRRSRIQNQGLLIYSTLALLAFIISFSLVGIALSPLIPMAIMLTTTLFVLFNSYRSQLVIDKALDKKTSLVKKILASDVSFGLLIGASALLICSLLIATLATGGLTLPVFAFTSGALMSFCSLCTLTSITLASLFSLMFISHLVSPKPKQLEEEETENLELLKFNLKEESPASLEENPYNFNFSMGRLYRKEQAYIQENQEEEPAVLQI